MRDAIAKGAAAIASEENPPKELPRTWRGFVCEKRGKHWQLTAANFFGHPAGAPDGGGYGYEREDHDDLGDRFDHQGFGRKDGLVWHDCVSHAGRRLSCAEHHAGVSGPAGISRGNSRRRRASRGAGGKFACSGLGPVMGLPFCGRQFSRISRASTWTITRHFDDYFAAKRRLFAGTGAGAPDVAVLNTDDQYGKRLAGLAKNDRHLRSGIGRRHHHEKISADVFRPSFTAQTPKGKVRVSSKLVGPHQRLQHSCSRSAPRRRWVFRTKSSRRESVIWKVFPGDSNASTWSAVFCGRRLCAHRRRAGKPDPHGTGAQSEGPHHHACSAAAAEKIAPNARSWAKPPDA